MPVDPLRVACPHCASQVRASCRYWTGKAWDETGVHPSRDRLASERHIEALENTIQDLIGWNPNPFPPEVVRDAKALLNLGSAS